MDSDAIGGKVVNSIPTHQPVLDTLERPVRDLRISVIDNCNLRCSYCMPVEQYGEHYQFLSSEELLSFDEIERVARAFVTLGVTKLRLTGGEPLLRKNMPELVRRLAAIEGVDDIALTTNGILLARLAEPLRAAGLNRLTVSLDSLEDEAAGKMNGRGVSVAPIVEGLEAARAAGFSDIKINSVVQRGVNEDAVVPLVAYCREHGYIVRFIEYMDVGNRNGWKRDQVVSSRELHDVIHAEFPLRALEQNYHGEVATRYGFADGSGEVGFISSVSEPFCGSCTRVRLSADGRVFTCLFASEGTDLQSMLREGASDEALLGFIRGIWERRSDRYSELRSSSTGTRLSSPKIEMYQIGG